MTPRDKNTKICSMSRVKTVRFIRNCALNPADATHSSGSSNLQAQHPNNIRTEAVMSGTRDNATGMTIARRRKLRDAWGECQESKPVLCITGSVITEQPIMNITNLPSVKGQLQFPTLSNCTESIHGGHVVQDIMAHELISKGFLKKQSLSQTRLPLASSHLPSMD